MKKVFSYFSLVALAFDCAVNYHLFVFPNSFAPAGLNGICTMIQYLFGISVGYLSLLVNIPLAILVYRKVSKVLAIRSMIYVVAFSLSLLLVEKIDLSRFAYQTDSGTSTILGPMIAGVISGTCLQIALRAGALGGGTDFIAAVIHRKKPDMNFFWISFSLNAVVAAVSYFVYDYQIEPVILCILYCLMSSTVSDRITKSNRSAVRFEIITENPDELIDVILHQFKHGVTMIPGKGMYSGCETNVLICVSNRSQAASLAAVIRSYPQTFAICDTVSDVVGNFKHLTNDGRQERSFLDGGDTLPI